MALNNLWFSPVMGVVKSNVQRIVDDEEQFNENFNNVGLVARNYEGQFLSGVMSPMKDMQVFQYQDWAIHLAMKLAAISKIPHIHIELDNIMTFALLVDQNKENLEMEGVTIVLQ